MKTQTLQPTGVKMLAVLNTEPMFGFKEIEIKVLMNQKVHVILIPKYVWEESVLNLDNIFMNNNEGVHILTAVLATIQCHRNSN